MCCTLYKMRNKYAFLISSAPKSVHNGRVSFTGGPDLAAEDVRSALEKQGGTFNKESSVKDNDNRSIMHSVKAYHDLKMKEYDMVINIWGADHHGYVPRMIAGLNALGHNTDKLDIHLIQFANLFRGKEKVSMSTRKGEFVELETLRKVDVIYL